MKLPTVAVAAPLRGMAHPVAGEIMGDYADHLRKLDQLHGLIERDPAAGGREAVDKIIDDVRAITDKISEDAEKIISGVNIEAEVTATKLKAEAKAATDSIRENAAKAASELIGNVKQGEDPKSAAVIAQKILQQAEKNTAELNRRADESVKAMIGQAEAAAFKFQRVAEAEARNMTQIREQATKKLADTTRVTAANFPESEDGPEAKDGRQAAAEIIKMLAQASDEVHRAATEAAAKIQEVAEVAIVTAKEAARDAAASVESAIGEANEKILDVTRTTITQTVGAEEAEFYDVGSLRDKWSNRPV